MKTRIAPVGRQSHVTHAADRCGSCGQPLGLWATDKLTGLLDRWGWDEEVPRVWTHVRHRRSAITLLVVDIDHFKHVNDEIGHPAGDAVLRAVADVLRDATRGPDIVLGRYGGHGGDEFLVLLPDTDVDGALAVARRIAQGIRSVAVPVRTATSTTSASAASGTTTTGTTTITDITASIGIAAGHPGHDLELFDDLLLNADAALRAAKSCGRDQIRVGREPGNDT